MDTVASQLTSPVEVPVIRTAVPVAPAPGQNEREQRPAALPYELRHVLPTVHSQEDVLLKTIQILLKATRAERGAVLLLADDGITLRPAVVRTRDGVDEISDPIAVPSKAARWTLAERKAIITADAGEYPACAHGASALPRGRGPIASIAFAPLVGQTGVLGMLYLENSPSAGAFAQEDLDLLRTAASLVGLAVENNRIFEGLPQAYEELARKVEQRTAALRQSEQKRYRAEKTASLSRLVAGVAHEINNPLAALKSSLEVEMVMAGRLATSEGWPERDTRMLKQFVRLAQQSLSACARITSVVRALQSFARLDEAEFKLANVNEGLSAAAQLLDPSIRRRVEVVMNLGDVPAIPCYPALLNEALMNLLINACQAIKDKGRVFIETHRDGDEVVASIRDTGVGIPREHLNNIFDPGFTTKGVGVGAGLGLAIALKIIEEHHGSIEVVSEPGHGATFIIRLPISFERVAKPVAATASLG